MAPDGCYQRTDTYACLTGKADNECAQYSSNPKCSLSSSTCSDQDKLNGQCLYQAQTYQCETTPASTKTVLDCAGQQFCLGGNCFNRGYTPDKDFGTAMAMMETAREGGVYGDADSLFGGQEGKCTIKLFGLANCCKTSGGGAAFSNSALIRAAAETGKQALDAGSAYVYDALYDASTLQKGLGAALGAVGADGLFNPSFGFYGFSYQFLPSQGFVYVGFDPTSLAIQVGLIILSDLMSCGQDEQMLALKRGQNLCHSVGTYCSQELSLLLFKICIEHTQSYCCYNSRLARIINEQGRGQIGKGWGSPESPQCGGFTQAEFARLDFSTMDLSEFIGEIMANVTLPDSGAMRSEAQSRIQTKMQNYYDQGGK